MALGMGSQWRPLTLVPCAVKVKAASLGLSNTASLTQILQVAHLRGTLNYVSFQDLWVYSLSISLTRRLAILYTISNWREPVLSPRCVPWVLPKREDHIWLCFQGYATGPRLWVAGWMEELSENYLHSILFSYNYPGVTICGLSLSFLLNWITWWEIITMMGS